MGGLGLLMRRRAIQAHPTISEGGYILSADKGDPEVFRVLMSKGISSDGVGITKEDAAKVKTFSTWFKNNSLITSFEESVYFTNVVSIPTDGFRGCTSLKAFNFSNIKTLGGSSFMGCPLEYDIFRTPNLETLGVNSFPDAYIKVWADMGRLQYLPATDSYATFGKKDILEEIYFPPTLIGCASGSVGTFKNYTSLRYIDFANVTELCPSFCSGCTKLDATRIPFHQFTLINAEAFGYCNMSIDELRLPSLRVMSKNSFRGNNISKWMDFGSIPEIIRGGDGFWNFGNYANTKIIRIPSSVTSIGVYAMYNYKSLDAIIVDAIQPPTIVELTFGGINNCPIYVPDQSVDAYKGASFWSNLSSRIKPLSEYQG